MSMVPGDMSSRIRAYESGLGPNPFQRGVPNVMPRQPMGGIAGLFDRLRASGRFQPQYPVGGGGFPGMGGFNPYQQMPRMGGFDPYQQMPRMGGGFFGGFMPRFKRRARPVMPDYSGQITSLEEKIKALQEQLAARQTGSAMPASMPASMPETRPTTASSLIPQVDPVALKELQDRVAGSGIPTPRPAPAIPMPGPSGMEGLGLDLAEIPMGRGRMGGGKTMVKPSSIERRPKPMPMLEPLTIAKPISKPTFGNMPSMISMPKKIPMPQIPMPQVDSMGRVAAPLTRGPVNVAINSPKLGIGRLGGRMIG